MSIYVHAPQPALRPFIEWLWCYADFYPDHDREHVLPDGTFELVINLQETPRRLFHRQTTAKDQIFRRGWISGAHTRYIVIDALPGSSMIGVHFKPGGAAAFLTVPAGELVDQVIELDALWGDSIWEWRDRLLSVPGPTAKFALLEKLLLRQLGLTKNSAAVPAVSWAIDRIRESPHVERISRLTNQIGVSHKHFIDLFRARVGLTPKKFCRVQRFQQLIRQIHTGKPVEWTEVAYACGYFDQAHLIHEFEMFSGLRPSQYFAHRLEGDPKFLRAAG